ncbi:potassium channel subfamily K member 1-like [Convolutriloba macropyga]|uniref:potassium channel subfamily K member 1-like n=1 Tax=Convolutriloba macropyga TaxID=536237 RepID=UPI003F521EFD
MHSGVRNFILFVILVVLYCMFMAVSALILIQVEEPFEKDWRHKITQLKSRITANHCISNDELEEFIFEVEFGQLHGFSAQQDMKKDNGWSFGSSLLFTTSIGTTVGYGHLAPGTNKGKFLTALLTAVSVPLTLLLTTVMVIRLLKFTRKVKYYLENRYGSCLGLFATRFLHLCGMFTCVLSFFVLISAIVFRGAEPSWNMWEALYFSIVSVSTVGLGDYVPGADVHGAWRDVYFVFCSVFLVIGVVFALLVLETLYEIPELGIHVYLLPTDEDSICDNVDFVNRDKLDGADFPANLDSETISDPSSNSGSANGKPTEKLITPQNAKPTYGVK